MRARSLTDHDMMGDMTCGQQLLKWRAIMLYINQQHLYDAIIRSSRLLMKYCSSCAASLGISVNAMKLCLNELHLTQAAQLIFPCNKIFIHCLSLLMRQWDILVTTYGGSYYWTDWHWFVRICTYQPKRIEVATVRYLQTSSVASKRSSFH